MRIAQVAPLLESVPPKMYGGTERVVSYLTEELVALGHEVTLYASADSVTSARLRPSAERSLRLDPNCRDPIAHHLLMIERVFADARAYDIVHFHIDFLHFPASRVRPINHVTTLHGRLDLPELVQLYREYRDMPVISISDAQRAPVPWANWAATVHNALPGDLLTFNAVGGDYLAFVGRISPEKGTHFAIDIARRAGMPLKIAAKVDKVDWDYFEQVVKPLLKPPGVEYVGEIGEAEKNEFLGNAAAMLFPIDWPEPFGLAMIESLACGTPVIACPRGSVREVIGDGINGFLVHNVKEAVQAVGKISQIDRQRCRAEFERHFTAERMAKEYLAVYRNMVDARSEQPSRYQRQWKM